MSRAFRPGSETAADGRFQRRRSRFRDRVSDPEPGRYHLYVSRACPWAHRTVIARMLEGLEDVIAMSVVDPVRDDRGWAFTGGEFVDDVNGFRFHTTLDELDARLAGPTGIVALRPRADLWEPPRREHLG